MVTADKRGGGKPVRIPVPGNPERGLGAQICSIFFILRRSAPGGAQNVFHRSPNRLAAALNRPRTLDRADISSVQTEVERAGIPRWTSLPN